MKTAISLPEHLFKIAEATARKMRISRSRLYAMAIEEFIDRHRTDKVTARLNKIYSTQKSEVDPALHSAQVKSLSKDAW